MFKIVTIIILFFSASSIYSQNIHISPDLKTDLSPILQKKIYRNLDSLFLQINQNRLNDEFIVSEKSDLTKSIFKSLENIEYNDKDSLPNYYQKQLINLYQIKSNMYSTQIAYISHGAGDTPPTLRMILHLIVENIGEHVRFTVPLMTQTKHWKSTRIGHTRYHYRDTLNMRRAEIYNRKNTSIASKLSVTPEILDFYMCNNYQEILKLLGIEYDLEENGQTVYGHGVDAGHIFSINNNEDFSHDIFHYYSSKINKSEDRNWIAEEGIAYYWGNPYYVDNMGEMIERGLLIAELKKYILKNPGTNFLDLFKKNTKIYDHISPKVSVRSTISSILCQEVEKRLGMEGILDLINCGRKPSSTTNYLNKLNTLISINEDNFNTELAKLINDY